MTDLQLIRKIKKDNCEKSLLELYSRHQGICNKMLQKYCKVCYDIGVSLDDLNSDKIYVVYKSALSFKERKNIKFSTWLCNQMRYHCLNTFNKNSKDISMENENIKYLTEKNQAKQIDNSSLNKEKVDLIFNILDQMNDSRVKEIFNLRYFSDRKIQPWNKIGKKMHISTQTVINIHNKALSFLNKKISSNISFDKI
ncbi:MAG: sigma-70 family RNA polymerase sigma factor [Caulobacteraceae bacterium]|nr:sigma-70 family RNA polymerase sigma factor [Caulobacteraceae bacterium]